MQIGNQSTHKALKIQISKPENDFTIWATLTNHQRQLHSLFHSLR